MKVIGHMNTPFTQCQLDEIGALAEANGYSLYQIPPDGGSDAASHCEILVGYIPEAMLKNARSLRWYQLPCAGANKYVSPELYPHGDFTLTNSSGAFGSAIAEHLIMGTLMLMRDMPAYGRQQREHVWHRRGNLRFLRGANVTILGTGNLGGSFASCCKAMGAHVTGVNRKGTPGEGPFDRVFPIHQRLDAIREADVVACCLPLTRETEGMLDGEFFAAMKEGAIFLNVGRGRSVDQKALEASLASGHLASAMLDVAEREPMEPECPLWDMENVIITPHISGSDKDPQNGAIIFRIFMDNLTRYFKGQPLENVVDRNKGY